MSTRWTNAAVKRMLLHSWHHRAANISDSVRAFRYLQRPVTASSFRQTDPESLCRRPINRSHAFPCPRDYLYCMRSSDRSHWHDQSHLLQLPHRPDTTKKLPTKTIQICSGPSTHFRSSQFTLSKEATGHGSLDTSTMQRDTDFREERAPSTYSKDAEAFFHLP